MEIKLQFKDEVGTEIEIKKEHKDVEEVMAMVVTEYISLFGINRVWRRIFFNKLFKNVNKKIKQIGRS